ncbi:hypothetical protein BDV28DRAFT_136986 [Aspergillus coremiiformis]|uniref:Vacuolar ATPase assembly protein VMA22 n=1 Tax=Aspergillus coremiiformis TaxID=138285 RepID=A0A5N6Z1F7_9EURO|nr:hypothetical protein BDV28DRAFT_136986 [Aspergillus coremiiformis]
MAQIPTPPASRHGSESPGADSKQPPVVDLSVDLLDSLDTLLERYLHLLDRHQKLQAELATTLSSGFLSLAQANYTCPPGRRYGADYYDERMKATTRVDLEPPTSSIQNPEISSLEESCNQSTKRDDSRCIFAIKLAPTSNAAEERSESNGKTNQPSSNDTSTSECTSLGGKSDRKADDPTTSSDSSETQALVDPKPKSMKKLRSSDPIRWYGILVPPFLRRAQKFFTEAVGGPLPELASVVAEMQIVEKEVKRVRSEIDKL